MLHDLLLAPFELGFMRRALAGCIALSLAGPPLGVFLVLRRMSLMSDVLQHGILPGIALGAMAAGLSAMGLMLYGDGAHRMSNVTGAFIPEGVDGEAVRGRMRRNGRRAVHC